MSLVIGAFIARPTSGTDATNMGLYNSDVITDRAVYNTPAEYRWYYLSWMNIICLRIPMN